MYRLLLFLLFLGYRPAQALPRILYSIQPIRFEGRQALKVELQLSGSAQGTTVLSLPAGGHDSSRFRLIGSKGLRQQKREGGGLRLWHAPSALLTLSYVVFSGLRDSLPAPEEIQVPMITDSYFYGLGLDLWVVPDDSSGRSYIIDLLWEKMPATWKQGSTFGPHEGRQRFSATLHEFQEAVYFSGDFRIHRQSLQGQPLWVAIRGHWSFADTSLVNVVERTVRAQRAYWQEKKAGPFLVLLLPVKVHTPQDRSVEGRALTRTFVTAATNSPVFGISDLFFLYNHEFMHRWFGEVLPQGRPENAFKWFHEGFTDYFAHRAMLEQGLFSEAEYLERINAIFTLYHSDSSHQYPNTVLEENYHPASALRHLPYQRGLIFASWLDADLLRRSGGRQGLKEVMLRLFAFGRRERRPFSEALFLKVLKEVSGADYSAQLQELIHEGRFIGEEQWKAATDRVRLRTASVFDYGFEPEGGRLARDVRILSVRPGSAAEAAGVRAGDQIKGGSFRKLPDQPGTLLVQRGTEELRFRYLPARRVLVPQWR